MISSICLLIAFNDTRVDGEFVRLAFSRLILIRLRPKRVNAIFPWNSLPMWTHIKRKLAMLCSLSMEPSHLNVVLRLWLVCVSVSSETEFFIDQKACMSWNAHLELCYSLALFLSSFAAESCSPPDFVMKINLNYVKRHAVAPHDYDYGYADQNETNFWRGESARHLSNTVRIVFDFLKNMPCSHSLSATALVYL